MRFVSLFSGGKDSTFALWHALNQGWECQGLVTVLPQEDSYLYHWPNIEAVEPLAEAMELPIKTKKGSKDELQDLKDVLSDTKADAVVSGAVASEYQRVRVEQVCQELGLRSFMPLWHKKQLWQEMLDAGFKVMITGVAAEGLGKDWLGRIIDERALKELQALAGKHRIHPIGEGGEFETLVVDCELYRHRLEFMVGKPTWDGSAGWIKVKASICPRAR